MKKVRLYGLAMLMLAGPGANGVLAQTTSTGSGQAYPTKPVRVQTTGAGSGTDFVIRIVSSDMSSALGQPVIVDNRPAGVTLASGVAKSPADGYTLLATGSNLWIAPLMAEAPYDPIRDFAPIAILSRSPNLLVVTSTLPVKTVPDLIRLARARPGELNLSTGSNGSSSHTAGVLFQAMAGVKMTRITYKEQSSQSADLISGETQISFGISSYLPLVQTGKLRAIATGGAKRATLLPNLPTIGETLPGYVSEVMNGFWAPARTPEAIVRRLNQEANRSLERAEARERMLKTGVEPGGGAPDLLGDYIRAETGRLEKLMKSPEGKVGG